MAGATRSSIAYNQGITFDRAQSGFLFDGVSSLTSSGVYRTDGRLAPVAATAAVIPSTKEGYNHAGDLSFDPLRRRILLPLECYDANAGGNTCGTGAIGVVDPVTLRLRYYVNLDHRQIRKAMWDEISPDGRWIWTSSGTHLLAYRANEVNRSIARHQRDGRIGGIAGVDLGAALPTGAVTGATFYRDPRTRVLRLLLSLNLGDRFAVVSLRTATATTGRPRLLSAHPSTIITVGRSALNNEPEGLAVTAKGDRGFPLGGSLHWQMLPRITQSTLFTRILNFRP
jgi:hypothetical protein